MHFIVNVCSGTEVCDHSQILGIKICESVCHITGVIKCSCEITRKGLENQQLSGPLHLEPEFLLKILSISVYAGFYIAL